MGRPRGSKNLTNTLFTTAEEDDSITTEITPEQRSQLPPQMGDPGWTDYVMGKLTDKEKKDNLPTTEGLRRIVNLLVGEIIKSKSNLVCSPTFENLFTNIVEHTVVVLNDAGIEKEYTAIGEGAPHNLVEPYDKSPAACASTKALGRALRDCLQLQTLVSEERNEVSSEDSISSTQIKGIEVMCNKLGLNLLKVINFANGGFKKIEDLTREDGTLVMRKLNEFQQNQSNIPEEYKNGA